MRHTGTTDEQMSGPEPLASYAAAPTPSGSSFEQLYLLGCLLINAGLCIQLAHVLRLATYQGSAQFHHILAWAIAINLFSAGILAGFRIGGKWLACPKSLYVCDWLCSLLPLVLIRTLRIPAPDHRQHVFGLVYVTFVFAKLAIFVAFVALLRSRPRTTIRVPVLLTSFVIYFALTPWIAATVMTNGDEPHYLLMTHSLLHDHDFDLRNNYDNKDYAAFYPTFLKDRHIVLNPRGEQLAWHDVGLPLLLVPGYAMDNRIGAMVEMNLFAAVLALGIFELALELGATEGGAIACWALLAFVSPVLTFSSQIYPEIPGGALAVWAAVAFARYLSRQSDSALLVAECLLAVMPWLSVRYWVVLGPMVMVIGLFVLIKVKSWPRLSRALVYLAGPIFISLLVFCLFDLKLFGKFAPNAGYLLFVPTVSPPMFQPQLHVGLLGLLFDRSYGLLPVAPVYLLAVAGLWPVLRRRTTLALALLGAVIALFLFIAVNHWWYGGGTPPPSRYILTGLALLIPFAGPALSRARWNLLTGALAAWSFVVGFQFTALAVPRHSFWSIDTAGIIKLLYDKLHINLASAFPSFLPPAGRDYLVAGIWIVIAAVVVVVSMRNIAFSRGGAAADSSA